MIKQNIVEDKFYHVFKDAIKYNMYTFICFIDLLLHRQIK